MRLHMFQPNQCGVSVTDTEELKEAFNLTGLEEFGEQYGGR